MADVLRRCFPMQLAERTPGSPNPGTSSLHKGGVLGVGEVRSIEDTFGDLGVQLLVLEMGEAFMRM
jgi:hypothetical protein